MIDNNGPETPRRVPYPGTEGAPTDSPYDMNHMVQIDKVIADLQEIKGRWGNTCVYIRRGGVSWGAVALNRQDADEKHGLFDLQAQHDRDMQARLEQIGRLREDRDAEREARWKCEKALQEGVTALAGDGNRGSIGEALDFINRWNIPEQDGMDDDLTVIFMDVRRRGFEEAAQVVELDWRAADGSALDLGAVAKAVRYMGTLDTATAPAESVAASGRSWLAGLRADFPTLVQANGQTVDWDWIDQHRPTPASSTAAAPEEEGVGECASPYTLHTSILEGDAQQYDAAVAHVVGTQKATTSHIQRHLQCGYNRAARIMDRMVAEGIITEPDDVGKRAVLRKPVAGARRPC